MDALELVMESRRRCKSVRSDLSRFLENTPRKKTLSAIFPGGGLLTVKPRLLCKNTICKANGMRLLLGASVAMVAAALIEEGRLC